MEDYELKELVLRALNRAYFYLKFRPRTKKEVVGYLNKKAERFHWPEEVVTLATADLEEEGLINDQKFVEWYVEQRNLIKQKSTFALRTEMMRLGISKDLLEEYFTESPINEEKLALEALKKKWSRFDRLDKRERFQKAAAYLSRRGFNFDVIKKTIKNIEE